MDLKGVDITVMSACMSGLGYITPDGVYGLQRGLKTAGVKTIISTLWSVDDEASSFFVIQLYKNLEAGMSVHEAFWTARETLQKYEKVGLVPHTLNADESPSLSLINHTFIMHLY